MNQTPHEQEAWQNRDDLGDAIAGAGRVLIILTLIGVIGVAVCLALVGCAAERKAREPRLYPRVILTDPESAYVLDLLNLRLDEPMPPPPQDQPPGERWRCNVVPAVDFTPEGVPILSGLRLQCGLRF